MLCEKRNVFSFWRFLRNTNQKRKHFGIFRSRRHEKKEKS
jgi:hypothetical protein